MAEKTVIARLRLEIDQYLSNARRAAVATRELGREISGMGTAGRRDIEQVGRGALLMAGGLTIALGASVKAAIDWESAWAGVTKTVDGTTAQMAELEDGLRNLASELPATHQEIAAVAEAAGALGIQRGAIEGFTKTMIDLGETTDLTADQAAVALAQIANIMGTAQNNFDRLGSTLVDLGNQGASTESEILELANRLAAAGHIAGLTEAEVFGFASTLASVGVEAEAGGTALSKVFTRVRDAVIDGGNELEIFAKVAGVTSKQFVDAFRTDPAGAIASFISGLGRMNAAGQSTSQVFKDLELNDERLKRALLSTAGAGELLTDQLEIGRRAWEENLALTTEAEKRYDTTAAKLEMARNSVVDLGIDLGGVLLPAITAVTDGVGTMARGFGELDGAAETAVTALGGIAAAGLGAIGIFGTIGPKVRAFQDGLRNMGGLGIGLANNLGKATGALVGIGAAVGVLSYVLGRNAQRKQQAIDLSKEYAEAIGLETGALNENIDALTARKLGEFSGATRLRELGADFDVLLEGVRETGDALELLSSQFNTGQLSGEFARELEEAGMAGTEFGDELLRIYELMGGRGSKEFDDFLAQLRILGTGYADGATLAANLESATEGVGDESATAAPKVEGMAAALGLNAEQAKAAEDALKDYLDAIRAGVDPLFGMLDALQANREALAAESEARAEGLTAIAEAQSDVADAERDVAAARARGDAEGTASAEERLVEARKRISDVQADAAITAAELAAMNQAVAESALDVEVAAANLEAAILRGEVSVEAYTAQLQLWVEKGLITAEQAAAMAIEFGHAADEADRVDGERTATFFANTEPARAAIQELLDLMAQYDAAAREAGLNPLLHGAGSITARDQAISGALPEHGDGGVVAGPIGSRQLIIAHGGETVLPTHKPGQMFTGPGGAHIGLTNPTGGGGSVAYDQSRHVTIAPTQHIRSTDPRRAAADVNFELHVLLAELSS